MVLTLETKQILGVLLMHRYFRNLSHNTDGPQLLTIEKKDDRRKANSRLHRMLRNALKTSITCTVDGGRSVSFIEYSD
jgi:hypothetical protein